ncbi:hypothetical protein ABT174_08490 [Streptomyces sparsogenes]|uniref:hypothetical protein n=1 Tax=Streptomyces sparsogenes TaxID=67365 RepID=UPI003323D259
MIVTLGLIILIAAVVVGVAGALTNSGSGHELTGGFSVFGHGMTGSTGTLFLYGIVVGAAALVGLLLAWTGVRHRRGSVSRREPKQSPRGDLPPAPDGGRRRRLHLFGHRPAPR